MTHNPVRGVKRPKVETNEGKTPARGDAQARAARCTPANKLKGKCDRAILSVLLYHALRPAFRFALPPQSDDAYGLLRAKVIAAPVGAPVRKALKSQKITKAPTALNGSWGLGKRFKNKESQMLNENRGAGQRQGQTGYAEPAKPRPSTKFDLEKLKRGDLSEIKSAAKKFQNLTPGQKDLIRHQAADSYAAIVKIVEMANSSQETAFKAQAHASNNFHEFCEQANSDSFSTRDEKNDSYKAADRAHERTTRSQESQNESNNESYVKIALVTGFTVVAGVAMVIFGRGKK